MGIRIEFMTPDKVVVLSVCVCPQGSAIYDLEFFTVPLAYIYHILPSYSLVSLAIYEHLSKLYPRDTRTKLDQTVILHIYSSLCEFTLKNLTRLSSFTLI